MGNLKHAKQSFLFNTLASTDFGVYTDNATSVKQLFIKGYGMILPAVGESSLKMSPVAGTLKSVYVQLSTTCPCQDCGAEYGIEIQNYDQKPGVFTYYLPIRKFYGGKLDNVVCSSNVLDATLVAAQTADIISQINADTLGAGAIVTAKSQLILGVTSATATSALDLTVVTPAGVSSTVTIDSTTPSDLADLIVDINADLNTAFGTTGVAYAAVYDTTGISISGPAGYYVSSTDATPTNLTIVDINRILLTAKTVARQFNVLFTAGTADTTVVTAGVFPKLTSADVAREFMIKPWQFGSQPNTPIKDASYTKYTIKATMGNVDDISAPNHVESFVNEVDIYVLTSLVDDHIWDATNYTWESTADNSGFSADSDLDDLLAYWKA